MFEIIAYIITTIMVIFAIGIICKNFKNGSQGKCSNCNCNCKDCGIKNMNKKDDKKGR